MEDMSSSEDNIELESSLNSELSIVIRVQVIYVSFVYMSCIATEYCELKYESGCQLQMNFANT